MSSPVIVLLTIHDLPFPVNDGSLHRLVCHPVEACVCVEGGVAAHTESPLRLPTDLPSPRLPSILPI